MKIVKPSRYVIETQLVPNVNLFVAYMLGNSEIFTLTVRVTLPTSPLTFASPINLQDLLQIVSIFRNQRLLDCICVLIVENTHTKKMVGLLVFPLWQLDYYYLVWYFAQEVYTSHCSVIFFFSESFKIQQYTRIPYVRRRRCWNDAVICKYTDGRSDLSVCLN